MWQRTRTRRIRTRPHGAQRMGAGLGQRAYKARRLTRRVPRLSTWRGTSHQRLGGFLPFLQATSFTPIDAPFSACRFKLFFNRIPNRYAHAPSDNLAARLFKLTTIQSLPLYGGRWRWRDVGKRRGHTASWSLRTERTTRSGRLEAVDQLCERGNVTAGISILDE